MKNRSFYFLGVLLMLISALFVARKIKRNYVPSIELSSLVLKDVDGRKIDLARYAGNPMVVNFWGTWCGPCRQEFPDFETVKEKYGDRVNFIMVSDEPLDKIAAFKTDNRYTFFYAQSQKSFLELGIPAVPLTYIYDAKGKLFAKRKDPINEKKLDDLIIEINNR